MGKFSASLAPSHYSLLGDFYLRRFCRRWKPPERARLNVLLITIDTLRPDRLSCYGGYVKTPHIDGLAERGVLFTRAFAHTP